MSTFTESTVESDALACLKATGWLIAQGSGTSSGGVTFTETFPQKQRWL